jgi:hypothetical protein
VLIAAEHGQPALPRHHGDPRVDGIFLTRNRRHFERVDEIKLASL